MNKVYFLMIPALLLGGCSGIGLKHAPDELSVIDAAPLTLPPNFELRPPREGEKKGELKVQDNAAQKAEELVLDLPYEADKPTPSKPTTEDAWLVEKAGGANRDESIRLKLEVEEDQKIEKKNMGWFERNFGPKNLIEAEQETIKTEETEDSSAQ